MVFNEKIKQIAGDVFAGDFGIKSVSVPENLTRAACELFRHQDSLADDNGFLIINDVFVHYFGEGKDVTVPDRIRVIDDGAFAENTVVEKITLPGTIERIGLASFGACASLKEINFPEGLRSIGSFAFAYCLELREAILPDSLVRIGRGGFEGCGALETLRLGENIAEIGRQAFTGCGRITDSRQIDIIKSIAPDALLESIAGTEPEPDEEGGD